MKKLYKNIAILLILSTSPLFLFQSVAKADRCHDKFPRPWQEFDRQRCRAEKQGGYETNKFDLKAKAQEGGWTASWADDISETDAAQGVVAAGVSIYSANSAPFIAWVEQLVQRTINSISADLEGNARQEAEKLARQVIYNAVSGKSAKEITKQFDTVDFKAGAIKYSGRNYLGNQTISRTWGLKPYVAFRVRSSAVSKPIARSSGKTLVNLGGGKCLDAHHPQMRTNGGKIHLYECSGGETQQWSWNGNTLINAGGGKCLDVHHPQMRTNGGKIQVWDCNGGETQQWRWNGNTLVNAGGKCLDVHHPEMRTNGGKIQVWDCNGGETQQWRAK